MNKDIFRALLWILGIAAVILIVILVRPRAPSIATPTPTKIPTHANNTPGTTLTPLPQIDPKLYPFQKVRLAWFYKPPTDQWFPILAEKFDVFILTHKDEDERDKLKALGVKSPILLYLQLLEIKNPGSCTASPQGNQVAYQVGDFCQIEEQHPDWFLLDQSGNRIVENSSVYMDPGNTEYRAFWLQRAKALQEQFHWDGFFIDNLEISLSKITAKGVIPAKYPNDAAYQAAIEEFLMYLRQNYFGPSRIPVLANIISIRDWNVWLHYLQYLDGAMIESFAVDWSNDYRFASDWEEQMEAIQLALLGGKQLILVAQGEQPDADREQFSLASYLLIANANTSFRYADSGGYQKVLLFDNYFLNLGQPLGARYKEGSSWRRDFDNGHVVVDPKKHSSEITLNP